MFLRGIFDHFGDRKNRFLEVFEVALELFEKCLDIVFGIKIPTFEYRLAINFN